MARTTIEIVLLAAPDYVLDAMIDYPRKFIRHVFRTEGETLDVTDICSADDLNRNPIIYNAWQNGDIDIVVTPGADDVDGAGFGNGPDPSDDDPEDVVAGGGDDPGNAATYARADHVHGIGAGEVGTTELDDASVTSAKVAVIDAGLTGPLIVKRVACAASGATGAADDITIYNANAPFAFRVIDAVLYTSTAGAGSSSAALRTASGGAGTQLSAAMLTDANGVSRPAGTTPTSTATVAASGSLYLRRSDRSHVGTLFVYLVKE